MKDLIALRKNGNARSHKIPQGVIVCMKCLIAVWALSGDSLSLILSGYVMDVPVAKYLFTMLGALDGWGIENVFMALGIGTIFYLVRDRQKNPWLSALSAFFAVCTVFGISYDKTGSWDGIFLFNLQFVLAVFVGLGYYFLYKNSILMIGYIFEKKKEWLRVETKNKLEVLLFEKHTFVGPFLAILVVSLPWIVAFFPGTLQWDAHAQLWMHFGVVEKTGHFPVAITEFMGGCIRLGRALFGSDSIGLFIYTGIQFLLQALAFSYASYTMRKFKAPIMFNWMALFLWGVYPYFPIWGFTMVKDSLHYIFFLVLIVTLQDIIYQQEKKIKWWQIALFIVSVIGIALTRNDGRYILYVTLIVAIIALRQYWKLFVAGIAVCFIVVFSVESIYMPANNIAKGPVGEMLSIPLQQTGRYLREHMDEVTAEEKAVLQEGFSIDVELVPSVYNPYISDGVKSNFVKNPDSEYLKEYFKVWFQQFLKHPDTYVQAFLNHTYGYFYPNRHNFGDYIAFFYIGNSEHWSDGHLDIKFAVDGNSMRQILEHSLHLIEKVPVLSMFLSSGMHTYILFGMSVYLWAKKKRREALVMVPAFMVLLICIASPVNAFLRYSMPIMITMPISIAWCYVVAHKDAMICHDIQEKIKVG